MTTTALSPRFTHPELHGSYLDDHLAGATTGPAAGRAVRDRRA